jgi:hypothetical protein
MGDRVKHRMLNTPDEEVALDLPSDVLRALDAWIAQCPAPHATRSEATVSILEEHLAARSIVSRSSSA